MSRRTSDALAHEVLASHELLIHTSVALLLLEVHISSGHAGLIEGLSKMLLKICDNQTRRVRINDKA
jgi:hypothetical protein